MGAATLASGQSMLIRASHIRARGAPGALKLPVSEIRAKIASGVRPAAESTPFPGRRLNFSSGSVTAIGAGAQFAPYLPSEGVLAPSALPATEYAPLVVRITAEQLAQVMTQRPNKWPETSWDHPSAYLRGFDHYSARRITAMPSDGTVVIHVWGYPDEAAPPRGYVETWLRATMVAFMRCDNGFVLIPPEPYEIKNLAPNALNVPVAWIATGLPGNAATQLKNQFAISTARITFTCSENSPRSPRHIGRIGWFENCSSAEIQNAVSTYLCSEWVIENTVPLLVNTHLGVSKTTAQLFEEWMMGVTYAVKRTPTNNTAYANVYCEPPTTNGVRWVAWAAQIRSKPAQYTALGGEHLWVSWMDPMRCAGCQGSDHHIKECPLLDVPGWKGEATGFTPADVFENDAALAGDVIPPPPMSLPNVMKTQNPPQQWIERASGGNRGGRGAPPRRARGNGRGGRPQAGPSGHGGYARDGYY